MNDILIKKDRTNIVLERNNTPDKKSKIPRPAKYQNWHQRKDEVSWSSAMLSDVKIKLTLVNFFHHPYSFVSEILWSTSLLGMHLCLTHISAWLTPILGPPLCLICPSAFIKISHIDYTIKSYYFGKKNCLKYTPLISRLLSDMCFLTPACKSLKSNNSLCLHCAPVLVHSSAWSVILLGFPFCLVHPSAMIDLWMVPLLDFWVLKKDF